MFFSPLLEPGAPAFPFHLLDQTGHIVTLEEAKGPLGTGLLFFSAHCLSGDIQALKNFADAYPQLQQQGLELVAISGLNWETLYRLSHRLALPYKVLFDPCCRLSTRYQCMLIPKFVTGRAIYLIDPQGGIQYASRKPDPHDLLKIVRGSP